MYPPFCALVAVICSCDVHIKFLLRVIFILHAFSFANTGVILKHHSVFFSLFAHFGLQGLSPQICHPASSKLIFRDNGLWDTRTHTHMSTPPETDEMPRGDWCCMKPPWSVSMTHTAPPPYPACLCPPSTNPCFAFPSQSASVRELCSDRLFFGLGGPICPAAAVSGPLVLRVPPYPHSFPFNAYTHTRMHIPSCFRGRLRSLQTHTHKGAAPIPPRVSAAKSFNLTPGQSGPLNFVLVVKST